MLDRTALASATRPRNPLLAGPILPTLLRLAAPNAVAMLATAFVAIAETSYVGRLGTAPLAGMALTFPMVMLTQMMSAGAMGGGVSSAISRALGAGDIARAQVLALHAVLIGLFAGIAFTVLFIGFGRTIYALLGGRGAALEQALSYSNVLFIGAVAIWLVNTLASVVRGTGNMLVPSATLLAIAVVQIAAGGALGLGIGPIPRLGMAGVAAGQVIAFSLGLGILLWFLLSGRSRIRLALRGAKLQRELFFDILKVGALACLSPMQSVGTVLIFTALVARFGTDALAGYGIGARLEFLFIPLVFAVGVACVPMIGMAIGAGEVARARRVAWTAAALTGGALGVVGVVMMIAPQLWAGLFTDEPAVAEAAELYLRSASPGFAFFGLGLCLYFASQGAGQVLGPVLTATLRLVIVAVGGWWLLTTNAPVDALFVLVGIAMAAYGISTAAVVYWAKWGKGG
jgi:putative MATE family efflux protein